ncbi:hypothetical protein QAD02_013859 [Eretmocerus hayati]|uniref:Uncharacterized protein n=1 Tax=Eretmocerus hayati TaxID=131215 RepID=A0ACC2P6H8_9HYME|nr:hypothetical protein QAD02_013859 [Eretmocerus hayati]
MTEIATKNMRNGMIVGIAGAFDVGWFTRGSNRSYDSPSGTGTLIGYFNKEVIGYAVLNCMCAMCNFGHFPDDHNCRLNFVGSAESMEPEAVVRVTRDNESLKKHNVEIGIIVADNDSSAILAAREVSDQEIVKQHDKNHTSKGVVSASYKIKPSYKELTSVVMKYLNKCFNFCVSQNEGNIAAMIAVIQNIPYHAFNYHNDCGDWCGFKKNPDNYVHSTMGDGLCDERLFEALKSLFEDLASKCPQFAAACTSNQDESMNHSIVSYAPEARVYAKSPSGVTRVACAVSKKIEEKNILDVYKGLNLSPGLHTSRLMIAIDKVHLKEHFHQVIEGFCDTLPITKKKSGKNSKGDNKLENSVKKYNICCDNAHDALYDCIVLEKVGEKLEISSVDFRKTFISWTKAEENLKFSAKLGPARKKLCMLNSCTSTGMRDEMIAARVTYEIILHAYQQNELDGIIRLFGEDANAIVRVTKNETVIDKIHKYFED